MPDMDLAARSEHRLRRWRRVSRIVSGSFGAAAIGGALYLGLTGPLVSPVQPPSAVVAAAPAPAAIDLDPDRIGPDPGRRNGRGGGPDLGGRR